MSKERHQSRSGGALASASSPPPDGSTAPSPPPLDESTTLPSFPPQPDGLTTSHSLPPFQDGPPRLSTSSHPDSEWSLQEIPTHPDEPPVSSLPSVPTMDNIGTNPTLRELVRDMVQQRQHSEALEQSANNGNSVAKKTVAGFLVLAVAGSWLTYYFRHRKHQHRTIDPDWYVSDPPLLLQTPKLPESQAF